jgi:hypothetical protein
MPRSQISPRTSAAIAGVLLAVFAAPAAWAQGATPPGTLVGAQTSDDVPLRTRQEIEMQRLKTGTKVATPAPSRLDQVKLAVKTAQALMQEGKYLEALAKLSAFDAVVDKTGEETYLIERTRVAIASHLNDEALLVKSMTAAMGSDQAPAGERLEFSDLLARKAFNRKDYAATVEWARRYFAEGGRDLAIRRAQVLAYYFSGDYAAARREVGADIQTEEAAGQKPSEEQLRLLVSCAQKLDDKPALASAQEKYAAYYPKKP